MLLIHYSYNVLNGEVPMKNHTCGWKETRRLLILTLCLAICSCGSDDSNDSGGVNSGATLKGNIVSVTDAAFQLVNVSDVTVSIGGLSVSPDVLGNFQINNIPTGDQVVRFENISTGNLAVAAETGPSPEYLLADIEMFEAFILGGIEINNSQVVSEHTATWTGTAGSTDQDSQGPIAFTMVIQPNGNAFSGTGRLGAPDNSTWNVTGTETGTQISGKFTLVSSDSECARDAEFTGVFDRNNVSGTFDEIKPDPDDGCGLAESGIFSLDKVEP